MSKQKLRDDLKKTYSLTGMEVDDLMRYMYKLCKCFDGLALCYRTEFLIEIRNNVNKRLRIKSEKNIFRKTMKRTAKGMSGSAKKLRKQYYKTQQARDLVIAAMVAHKLPGDQKRTITDILAVMAKHEQLDNKERTVTGRRAFESLQDTGA